MTVSAVQPADRNGVPAAVRATTYLGASMRLGLATRGGTPLTVTLPIDTAAQALSQGPEPVGDVARRQRFSSSRTFLGTGARP